VTGFGERRNVRSERNEGAAETQNLPDFAHFAESTTPQSPAQTGMGIDASLISHDSQAEVRCSNADEMAVF